ncbi:MAG TPA: MBL fold metallo-hydrolase [Terriglobia bacterium]|nr:MBL fold metallo-hydrolase [Terriglobia bacterium]
MAGSEWKAELLLTGSWRGATSVLLSNGRHHLVVDTGMPHEAPQLLRALEARGLKPADVSGLISTHFHVDHVLNNSLFPACPIHASQRSYDWCCSLYSDLQDDLHWERLVLKYYPETFDYERARELMGKLRKLGLRMWDRKRMGAPEQFVWIENRALPEGLQAHITSGHVPGHVSILVPDGGGSTVIAGDALLSRDRDDQILTMIPYNREEFRRDREGILAMSGRILPGHDQPFQAEAVRGTNL